MGFGDARAEEVALPPGWRWVALREVCDVSPKTAFDQLASDDLISFIPMAAVEELTGRMDTSNLRPVADAKSGYTRFSSGDVIFAKITPCMENGKIAVVPPLANGVAFGSSEYHVLRPRPELDARYLFHYLAQQTFRNDARRHMSGAVGQQRVPADYMRDARLPLPPLDQQHRIVSLIEELFGEVEAGEQELAASKADLRRYRRAVLKAAVTGELTRDWREQNPPNETGADLLVRILKERRARWEDAERAKFSAKGQTPKNDAWKSRYPEPVAPNTADLPELPDGWAWSSLDQLTFKMTSGSRAWSPYYDRGSSIFIMAQNVRPARFDLSFKQFVDPPENDPERERTRVAKDDVLVTIVGANTGDVCRLTEQLDDAYVCQSVALLRPVDSDWSGYIEAFLVADEGGQAQFAKQIYGAGRPHLSFDQLRSVVVPIPPSGERAEVTALVREAIDLVAEFASQIDAQAKDVVRLRQSILGAAFSGKLITEAAPTRTKTKRRNVA